MPSKGFFDEIYSVLCGCDTPQTAQDIADIINDRLVYIKGPGNDVTATDVRNCIRNYIRNVNSMPGKVEIHCERPKKYFAP